MGHIERQISMRRVAQVCGLTEGGQPESLLDVRGSERGDRRDGRYLAQVTAAPLRRFPTLWANLFPFFSPSTSTSTSTASLSALPSLSFFPFPQKTLQCSFIMLMIN